MISRSSFVFILVVFYLNSVFAVRPIDSYLSENSDIAFNEIARTFHSFKMNFTERESLYLKHQINQRMILKKINNLLQTEPINYQFVHILIQDFLSVENNTVSSLRINGLGEDIFLKIEQMPEATLKIYLQSLASYVGRIASYSQLVDLTNFILHKFRNYIFANDSYNTITNYVESFIRAVQNRKIQLSSDRLHSCKTLLD